MHRSEKPFSTEISVNEIEKYIYTIRDQQIMLDSDIANIFQMETKVLKQAVRRNINHFPPDFMFELTKQEQENLRSQIVTLQTGSDSNQAYQPNLRSQIVTLQPRSDLKPAAKPNLRSQIVTLPQGASSDPASGQRMRSQLRVPRSFISKGRDHFRFAPFAFTEQGVAMLSSVLHSESAIQIKISIMRAFVQHKKQPPSVDTKVLTELSQLRDQMSDLQRRIHRIENAELHSFSTVDSWYEPDIAAIVEETVAKYCGVMVENLKSTDRSKAVARARHLAVYMMRKYLNMSFPEIGRQLNRDHSTIMYAYEKVWVELERDESLRKAIVQIGKSIGFC